MPPSICEAVLTIGGVRWHFEQHDFHTSFMHFLLDVPPNLQMTRAALEVNRCFFVHMGVGMQVHPFALQTAMRHMAATEGPTLEDWLQEIVGSIRQYSGFVDANALPFIWPQNFDKFRLLFISGPMASPILTCFVPTNRNRPVEELMEVIIRCSGDHFTLFRPSGGAARIRVISRMLEEQEKSGGLVQVSDVTSKEGNTIDEIIERLYA
eukprot:CAMPEP_0173198682 /NCGR_PEP_ID=MMETSP1141-20130122/16815_1 /TAXON_ID=483371 /ORGANISM="non described non described, Strain CCMP2298" /LENGTH=208 /DNA_ID=CAMNT_0014123487 /DNA_START=13 /DNA_END=639 /DNA_ORIENTATION=-